MPAYGADGFEETLRERLREVKVAAGAGGHGGGDVRMPADLFGERVPDESGRAADAVDGARSLATGPAANRSLETRMPVAARELLDV